MPHPPPALYAQVSTAASLDALRWQNRILLIFAAPGDPALQAQRTELAPHQSGLAERDLAVLVADDPALRQREGVSPQGFAAVLIGKDGGVKLRSTVAIPFARLAETIDAMPMRRSEASSRPN